MRTTRAEVPARWMLGKLLHKKGYETGVELGVDRGLFAQELLGTWFNCTTLYCVDPWTPYEEMLWDRQGDYDVAVARLHEFPPVRIVRSTGNEFLNAVVAFREAMWFDFVYIDADHRLEYAKEDIKTWWPHISDRGMLAGHDFDDEHPGVKQAVTEFAERNDLIVYVTQEETPSWYIYRLPPKELLS